MPFFFLLIGFGLIIIGYRGTQAQFFELLKEDFSGQGNFFIFALGIFLVGLVGYVPKLKGLSNAFMGLIIVVMILANKGFFEKFTQQIQGIQNNVPQTSIPPIPAISAYN